MQVLANQAKTKVLIVSLLYLMRNGIQKNGNVVLPKLPVLNTALPLEIFLQQAFEIPTKCITEVSRPSFPLCPRNPSPCSVSAVFPVPQPTHAPSLTHTRCQGHNIVNWEHRRDR